MDCGIWFANTLLRIFYIYIYQGYWCIIFFLVMSLSEFGVRVMLASYNESGSAPSFLCFLEQFEKEWYNSLNVR